VSGRGVGTPSRTSSSGCNARITNSGGSFWAAFTPRTITPKSRAAKPGLPTDWGDYAGDNVVRLRGPSLDIRGPFTRPAATPSSTLARPDKAEVGGSSPLRPTRNVLLQPLALKTGVVDVLRDGDGELAPVQWRSYIEGVHAYQGEVTGKAKIQKRFAEKVKRARTDAAGLTGQDWSGLGSIIAELLKTLRG
jgi:hypothetical protein